MHKINWHTIWIIGAGRFGQPAAQRICNARPQTIVTLIDPEPLPPTVVDCRQIRSVQADGISFLVNALDGQNDPDWIVPAAPVHVAFEWMCRRLSSRFAVEPIPVPGSAVDHLPNPQPGSLGTLYVSNAAWVCPDDCPEPADCCTVTGKPHPCIVYRALQEIQTDGFESVAIRSRQLLPGVGGYSPDDLYQALNRVSTTTRPVLLSTACCCHGVIDAFRLNPLEI